MSRKNETGTENRASGSSRVPGAEEIERLRIACGALERDIERIEKRAEHAAKAMRETSDRKRGKLPVWFRCIVLLVLGILVGTVYFWFAG